MPYILPARRVLINNYLEELLVFMSQNDLVAGDLNYIYTMINKVYIEKQGENYQNYNNVIGGLEACKLELYRKSVAPYEEIKEKQNGSL